jgi:hypothetical protein
MLIFAQNKRTMKIEGVDTRKLRYNPKSKNFIKQLRDDIPEFAAYSGHKNKKPEREQLFGYIALLYDINSPMGYEVLDYYEKKSAVAEMMEFPRKGDEWEEYVDDMILGQNKEVNELIAAFIAQFGSPEYIQKIAYTEMLRRETVKALSQKAGKDTLQNIEKLTSNLKEVDRVLYQSGKKDELTEARNALYAKAVKDRVKIRPEDIVDILEKDGDLPQEFDQYPSLEEKKPNLSFYNESKEEREERKQREKEEVTVKKDDQEQA